MPLSPMSPLFLNTSRMVTTRTCTAKPQWLRVLDQRCWTANSERVFIEINVSLLQLFLVFSRPYFCTEQLLSIDFEPVFCNLLPLFSEAHLLSWFKHIPKFEPAHNIWLDNSRSNYKREKKPFHAQTPSGKRRKSYFLCCTELRCLAYRSGAWNLTKQPITLFWNQSRCSFNFLLNWHINTECFSVIWMKPPTFLSGGPLTQAVDWYPLYTMQ